ncbi:MAG: enoate reductase [Epulopiscium sp. Nuni2H_MBin003]|nr:MAG: enoate reductase [Epulopiscium sp. Nuni2H_MBin003]
MENKYYPHLAQPITINGLTFKNRVLGAPMSNPEMDTLSQMRKEDIAFHEHRASGGLSSVCIGLGVVEAIGRTHTKELTLYDPMSLPSLKEFSKAMHRQGCNAVIELTHGGKYANARGHSDAEEANAIGPNDEVNSAGVKVRAMTDEDILQVAESFGKAAALCKEAGVDMVLVHGGHGWLLHQFISPDMNKRTDKWGGSLENRMRLTMLVIEKIREYAGNNYPIEFRMSGAEFSDGGYTVEEGIKIAKMLDGKVDIIHVSAGVHENPEVFGITHPTMFIEEGCNAFLAREIKKHVKTPVATVGGFTDIDMMEEMIANGTADIVEVARQSICDPHFVEKAFCGQKEDIVKCCRCFTCFYNYLANRTYACAFNPVVGNEFENKFKRPDTIAKKVVVVGGGPGGMQAAITAAERGHSVSLYEAQSELGGQLLAEKHIPFKKNMYNFVTVLSRRIKKLGIDVHLNTNLDADQASQLNADVIIVAVGASQIIPNIKGIDNPKVVTLDAIHSETPQVGQKIVILGGGLVGSECAIYLNGLGKDVTLVELKSDYASDASFMHKGGMESYMKKSDINIILNTYAKEITNNGVLCTTPDGDVTFEYDNVLLAVGMRANQKVAESFYNCAPRVYKIGDSIKPGLVVDAVSTGYYKALDI